MAYEYVGNLHMHTPYSDGSKYHAEIAEAARQANLDFIVVTDHNIYVDGLEGYYGDDEQGYVLVLIGEEIHDRMRLPQVNHCLVYGVGQELCHYAHDPQHLLDQVEAAKGLSFLAHPLDKCIPFMDPLGTGIAIPWVDWGVSGYTGLEIWNFMAVWKDTLQPLYDQGYRGLLYPETTMVGPRPETLAKWDELLAQGQRVVGIGNSDAHGFPLNLGLTTLEVFPYEFLFRCVNTHILTPTELSGDAQFDSEMIYSALRQGHAFIGYHIIDDPRGFKYSAQGMDGGADMGETIRLGSGVTLQTKAPSRAHLKIIRHGEVVAEVENADALVFTAREAGAYRVEAWREYRGKPRCWILSNPIYVLP